MSYPIADVSPYVNPSAMAKTHYEFMGQRLTRRQMQIISLNVHGLYQRQIAGYLRCTEGTVKSHFKDIANILHTGSNRSRVLCVKTQCQGSRKGR